MFLGSGKYLNKVKLILIMRQRIISVFAFLPLVVFVGSCVFACVSFPEIGTKNNCTLAVVDFADYRNETVILGILNNQKESCGFNSGDINIIKDFIINGYSVNEQTLNEYQRFLKEVKVQNNKSGCTAYYPAVTHIGGWTGYILDSRVKDEFGNDCPLPDCTGASIKIIWNDLLPTVNSKQDYSKYYYWVVLGVVFILLILIMKIIKKNRSTSPHQEFS